MAVQKFGIDASKEHDFHEWYVQVVKRSELIDYYDIRGMFVMRPASMFIWSEIRRFFEEKIRAMGVSECYFPMLVTKKSLETEKAHLESFDPELAWVTRCGDRQLDEPVALRPTSEAIMYPYYSRWLRTYRDLPLRLNQWCSVIRWEVKSTLPFIRGREFLWQEGHTAFYDQESAIREARDILEAYAAVYEELLAVPVIRGTKSRNETFGGADYTLTVEAFIPSTGRGIQAATSHHLGQNFSKMFDVRVETDDSSNERSYVFQNSWGLTTRSIGVAVMLHSDDRGFVCPPRVASTQVVIVPCGIKATTSPMDEKALLIYAEGIRDELAGDFRVVLDARKEVSPGFKFNHWEVRGVPLRIEVGFRDMEKDEVCLVRRDTRVRTQAGRGILKTAVSAALDDMHRDLFEKARKARDEQTRATDSFDEFKAFLDQKCIVMVPWCGGVDCEKDITRKTTITGSDSKEETSGVAGAKSLCLPFNAPPANGKKCINCSASASATVLFGRSY